MWQGQLALTARGWRVIAPHFRGFDGGESDPPAQSIDDYAGDVIDLLDALHIDDAIVGGLSMGGYVAFALLRHAARYVQGLILADTKAEADTPEGVEGRKRMIQLARDKGAAAVADEMIPKLLGETTRRTQPDVVDRVRALATSSSAEAIASALHALMTRPDSRPQLSAIHVPTLIVVGDEDTVTPRAAAEEMHRGIAGSKLAIIPNAGHLTNLEQADAFDAAIAGFLDTRV
jgi:pimeloyl-ACP methyl ester carboxylesterase